MLQILTADHNPDSIRAVPCAVGPNETTLLVTITGGTAPFTATALISNGSEVSMAPTGGSSYKATVGSFKANAVGSYTWSAKVSDANGSVASKNNGSKFVVVACG